MDIYFVQAETGQIKIGRAANARQRLFSLQVGSPVPLKLIAVTEGSFRLEEQLHERFNHLRLHGEWFYPGPELQTLIASIVANPNTRPMGKQKPGAKGGPQPRLRARILMLLRAHDPEKSWRPWEVGKALIAPTDECGRILRSSREIKRIFKGHYRLIPMQEK